MNLILWILLALHLLLTFVYIWDWFRDFGRLQEAVIRSVFCLFLPYVGFIFCKLVDFFQKKYPQAQMDELYLGKGEVLDELDLLRPVDMKEELNKAPGVDTLRSADYDFRRRMVMETLKEENALDYLSVLKEALANEDMETSHYASAVIMDLQKHIQTGLLEQQKAFEKNPQDLEHQEKLESELFRVIESGAFDESSLARYYLQYSQVSDSLLARESPEDLWLHNRVTIDLRTGDLRSAQEKAARFVELFPDNEDAVVDMIQVCLRLQDRELLDGFLNKLGAMPVVLTSKSLQYIRFLNGTEPTEVTS